MALPNFKDIVELVKKGATIEAQEKIAELRDAALEQREVNQTLREENSLLRKKLDIQDSLSFDGSRYWLTKDGSKEGPFCQVCWDRDNKLIRLQKGMGVGSWRCEGCKTHFRDETYSPAVPQVNTRRPRGF